MSSGTIREEDLAFLIQRKREQYQRTGVRDALAAPYHRRLLTELAACQSKNLRGVLTTLTAGDRWMASHFGIQRGGTLHYCFPVYNAEMSRYSPGRLLLREITEQSPDLGIRVIDRGIGDSPAKREFANGERYYLRGLWQGTGLKPWAARALRSLEWRLSAPGLSWSGQTGRNAG
jgi:CelD/BcsL family acetyltransferase involved in cellulose biosynthesis